MIINTALIFISWSESFAVGLRVGQTSKSLRMLQQREQALQLFPWAGKSLGNLYPGCFTAAASVFSSFVFAVKMLFFPTSCLFPYDLSLKSGYGSSHDLLPLQLCHSFVSTPKLLSEITALEILILILPACMLLPSGENSDYCEHWYNRSVWLRVFPKRTSLGPSIVVVQQSPPFCLHPLFHRRINFIS